MRLDWRRARNASQGSSVFEMFLKTLSQHTCVTHRQQGVAFLSAAKELYSLAEVAYACANVPILKGERRYSHCVYSSAFMGQWVSAQTIGAERDVTVTADADGGTASFEPDAAVVLKLPQHVGECAFFGVAPSANPTGDTDALRRQLRVLGSYFHEHMLRLNGHHSERQLLLSARELDCLKWTAEGKTAWEASVILGISERTVRFHLNAAREKLQCATTTQAVAKAVRDNMIEL
jgi:DNA-binding CsgD family transcriptional regulator